MKYKPLKYQIPKVMLKERLLESAFHNFNESGYIATNPDSITKPAGVSRVTFYSYFKNKNDILLHLTRELFEEFSVLLNDSKAHKIWLNSETPEEFSEPLDYIIEILSNSSGVFGSFIQGMMGDKDLLGHFDIFCEQFARMFFLKIQGLQRTRRYQGCDAFIISKIMSITVLMSVFSMTSIKTIECSKKELSKNLAILFFNSLNVDEKKVISSKSGEAKSEKGRNTRRRILLTAQKEFNEYGYSSTTIEQIAKAAGYSRGTIYQYYKKKKDIQKALKHESVGTFFDQALQFQFDSDDKIIKKSEDENRHHALEEGVKSRNQRSENTIRNIISAAIQEFSTYGYFDATIENIALKAGYSRSTLYLYFKKKDDLIRSIIYEMLGVFNLSEGLSNHLLDSLNTASIDELVRINYQVIEIFNSYALVNWAILQGSYHSKELAENFKMLNDLFSISIASKIKTLKKTGKCKGVDPDIAAKIIIVCISYTSAMYNAGKIKCSQHELALNLAKFLFGFFNH